MFSQISVCLARKSLKRETDQGVKEAIRKEKVRRCGANDQKVQQFDTKYRRGTQ